MSSIQQLVIIGADQALAARLPEVLAHPDLHITVIGLPTGQLRNSAFIARYVEVGTDRRNFDTALLARQDLLSELPPWTVWGEDNIMRFVANSDLPEAEKTRVLPVGNTAALRILGSKIGQAEAFAKAGVPTPHTTIVRDLAGVAAAVEGIGTDCIIKADQGGGGGNVRRITNLVDTGAFKPTHRWFPAIMQQFISGPLVSVEALFAQGALQGMVYSDVLTTESTPFSPSSTRLYRAPRSTDVLSTLETLGAELGLHGFASITFLWCHEQQRHLIIELDVRPNAWVQFGPRLGVDWAGLILNPTDSPVVVPRAHEDVRISLYPRSIRGGIKSASWSALRPWVTREPGTWETRNRLDTSINRVERRQIASGPALAHYTVFTPAQRVFKALPLRMQTWLETRAVKGAIMRLLGHR